MLKNVNSLLHHSLLLCALIFSATSANLILEDFEDDSPAINNYGGHWKLSDDNAPSWDKKTYDPSLDKYTDPDGMLPGGDSRFSVMAGKEITEEDITYKVITNNSGDTLSVEKVYPEIQTSQGKGVNGSACLEASFILGAKKPQWGHDSDEIYDGFLKISTTILPNGQPAKLSSDNYISFQAKVEIPAGAEALGAEHLDVEFNIQTNQRIIKLHDATYKVKCKITKDWQTFRYKLEYGHDTDSNKEPEKKFYQHNWWHEYISDPTEDVYWGWECAKEDFVSLIEAAPLWEEAEALIWVIKNHTDATKMPNGAFAEEEAKIFIDNVTIEGYSSGPFIHIDNAKINEEKAPQQIGVLTTYNGFDSSSVTHSIIGGKDKELFELKNDTLFSTITFDYENSAHRSLEVQIQSAISDGETIDSLFTIEVLPINDNIPVIKNESIELYEGTTDTITVINSDDTDADDQTTFYTKIYQKPKQGALTKLNNNQYEYKQSTNTIGTIVDTVVLSVKDSVGYDKNTHTLFDTVFVTIHSDLKLATPTFKPFGYEVETDSIYFFSMDTSVFVDISSTTVNGETISSDIYDIHYALNQKPGVLADTGKINLSVEYVDSLISAGESTLTIKAFAKSQKPVHWLDSDEVSSIYKFRKALLQITIIDTIAIEHWLVKVNVIDAVTQLPLTDAKLFYTLDGTEPDQQLSAQASFGDTLKVPNGSTLKVLSHRSGYIPDYHMKAFADFAGGDGSKENPYKVASIEQLQNIQNYLDKHFIIVTDIDASVTASWNDGLGFSPIGRDINNTVTGFQGTPFSGSLKSNYHTIKNLYINRPSTDYVGLFGSTTDKVLIEKLSLTDFYIKGENSVGAIAGENSGTISQLSAHGVVNGNDWIGTLLGKNSGLLRLSSSKGTVIGNTIVGGLCGYNSQGVIENSYTRSSLQSSSICGGIVGQLNAGEVKNSYSLAKFTSSGALTAGIFGMKTSGIVQNCFWRTDSSNITPDGSDITAKSEEELLSVETYTDTTSSGLSSAWDFIHNPNNDTQNGDYWLIDESVNEGYPSLQKVEKILPDQLIVVPLKEAILYPNPATATDDFVTFLIPQKILDQGAYKLTIFDNVGNLIFDTRDSASHIVWNKTNYNNMLISSGSYAVFIQTENSFYRTTLGIQN